mgnify:CR=1 FL=1
MVIIIMVINLKNKLWLFLILLIIIGICVGFYLFFRNKNSNDNNYTASKSSVNEQNTLSNNSSNNIDQNCINTNKNIINITKNSTGDEIKSEEEIASFSTKIYDTDPNRQNNISITCNTLNDTIVANGSTFSFCNTVGQATSDKGYKEAKIFDNNGKIKQGLGGGNCQISSTLYNAVMCIPTLVVTERHHSNKVPYIQTGKDAAVAYGSYDFKFRNDYGFDIKIKAANTPENITVTLYKIN